MANYELFLRGALDKIGALPDAIHVGDYKTASNTFTETRFTPAHREMARVAEQRSLRPARARHRGRAAEDRRRRARSSSITVRSCRRTRCGPASSTIWRTKTSSTTRSSSDAARSRRCVRPNYRQVALPSLGLNRGPRIAVIYAVGMISSGRAAIDSPDGPGPRLRHDGRIPAQGARRRLDSRHRAAHRQPGRLGDRLGRHLARDDADARRRSRSSPRCPTSPRPAATTSRCRRTRSSRSRPRSPARSASSCGKFVIDGTLEKLGRQHRDRQAREVRRHLLAGAAVHAGRAQEHRAS